MAAEGILFTRMYTEVGCTPSRAACMTGRHPRSQRHVQHRHAAREPRHAGPEVTLAEVLSNEGLRHGLPRQVAPRRHRGELPHNQGFDEAFFTGYNQILSLNTRKGEGANATIGLYEDMLPEDPYKLDDTFVTKGWVQVAEGTKGGPTRSGATTRHENYMKIDPEAQRRTLEFIERNARPASRSTSPTGPT